MTYFLYCFTARLSRIAGLRLRREGRELNIISFAVEGTAKENSSKKAMLYRNTGS